MISRQGVKLSNCNSAFVRPHQDLSEARVFDFKRPHPRQRPAEQDRQQHADDAAVAENRHLLAAMVGQDLPQARLHSLAADVSAHSALAMPSHSNCSSQAKALTPNFACTSSQASPVQSPKSTSRKSGRMTGFGAPLTSNGASVCWTRFIGLA